MEGAATIFFLKLRMGKRQLIGYFEVNPAKGSGVIEIPRKFPFWGEGKGLRQNNFFLSLVDQMLTANKF